MLDMGCIYCSADEISDVSFLCSEKALFIGIVDCKGCYTLQIVCDGFISTIQLDLSHCIDVHSKSSVVSAQPLLVAFCDAACQVLVLDLSTKLHGGGLHFKFKATSSSAQQGHVPVDRVARSLFGLSTGGRSSTSDVDADLGPVEYMSREETTRCIIKSYRFDRGSGELTDRGMPSVLKSGRFKQSSVAALIVRSMRKGTQHSSSSGKTSLELIEVRLSPSVVTVDLLRLGLSSKLTGLRSKNAVGKVENLTKYFDDLNKTSRNDAASRKQSFKVVGGGELQSSIESIIGDFQRESYSRSLRRNGMAFSESFARPKKIMVSFARCGSASVSLVKVVAEQEEFLQQEAFVISILRDPADLDRGSKDRVGESIQYSTVYRLSRAHDVDRKCKMLEFLDFDDSEACKL